MTSLAIVQFLATTVIAVFVAYIAWQQHQTAQQKLVLDLFDKRFAAYMNLRRFVSLVSAGRKSIEADDVNLSLTQAKFLFPAEIAEAFEEVHAATRRVEVNVGQPGDDPITGLTKLAEKLKPYMAMTQKLPGA